MSGHNIAYVRVSTVNQKTDRQEFDIKMDRTFEEKASAGSTKRPIMRECLAYCRTGDTLHVYSIDRLARNLWDLQGIVQELNDKGVTVTFHKENLSFSGNGDNPLSKLMMQMVGAFAEFERSLIRERQREGIAKAQKKGTRFGKKPTFNAEQKADIKKRVADGEQVTALARELGVSRVTIYAVLKG